jgi:signal transduction histidine kinase
MFQRSDGKEFPTQVSLQMLRLDKEMVLLSSIWDISRRAEAEQQLIQAQKMAAMGEMLSAIAHQWRQPLNALSTYIASLPSAFYNQMITREFIDKLVNEADSQIQFMSRTINDFRQYFHPSKNKQAFDVFDSIQSAVKLIMPQLKQKTICLQIHKPRHTKTFFVYGYKNEFVHVLVNILSNAKDAILEKQNSTKTDPADPRIDIFVNGTDGYVTLVISDNGCGVPRHLLTKIFTPYFTTKGTATGTGIGLYMAKTIVEKEMNGSILVENNSDGASLIIRLPLMSDKKR